MLPLTVVQYIVISLRLECRVLVVATELMVARAMIFLCSSGTYATLLCLTFFLIGGRQECALMESIFMMHSDIIWLFCEARSEWRAPVDKQKVSHSV